MNEQHVEVHDLVAAFLDSDAGRQWMADRLDELTPTAHCAESSLLAWGVHLLETDDDQDRPAWMKPR